MSEIGNIKTQTLLRGLDEVGELLICWGCGMWAQVQLESIKTL